MAAELKHPKKQSCDLTLNADTTAELNKHIESARESLLFRKFEKCHKDCLIGINKAKIYAGRPSANDFIEQLCVLCIQALAEMNKWQEVLPLVQTVYSSIEKCPHTIIALCILLHARVKEFIQCHAIANVWLKNQERKDTDSYREVVNLYIEHVVVPQRHTHLIPQFLDSCIALDTVAKEEIIEEWRTLSLDEKKCEDKDAQESTEVQKRLSEDDEDGNMSKNMNRVKQILQGILRTFTSVFTPYRMGR